MYAKNAKHAPASSFAEARSLVTLRVRARSAGSCSSPVQQEMHGKLGKLTGKHAGQCLDTAAARSLPMPQPAPVRGVRLGAAATKVALAPPWALLGHRVVLRTMYTWSLGVAIASWVRFHVLRGHARVTTLLRRGVRVQGHSTWLVNMNRLFEHLPAWPSNRQLLAQAMHERQAGCARPHRSTVGLS